MNGVLVIDKPEGLTSHDVVARVRRILKTKAVGHTGTLDPFATGVLVVLIGRATRLAQFLGKAEKEYLATIRFGFETTTGDRTGTAKQLPITNYELRITRSEIENVLAKFRGEIWQTPPMYSAKKIAGKKLYELARKGEEVERQPVKVTISALEIIETSVAETIENQKSKIENLTVRVVSSAGTYIRVLAEDIGKELGIGAHLAALRRTRAGSFALSRAITLEQLEELTIENKIEQVLLPPNDALAHMPFVALDECGVKKILNGNKLSTAQSFVDGEFIRICDEQKRLIAVGVFNASENSVQPRVVLSSE